jgi:hypothetical protein
MVEQIEELRAELGSYFFAKREPFCHDKSTLFKLGLWSKCCGLRCQKTPFPKA